jgi:sensor histidine kinase YesM
LSGKTIKKLKTALLFFGIGTLIGLMNFSVALTTSLAEEGREKAINYLIWEFTGAYSFIILLPIMLWLFRKYPLTIKNFYYLVPLYLASVIPVAAMHTAIMFYSRQIIYSLLGWGEYNYGLITYRYLMEYIKLIPGLTLAYLIYHLFNAQREREKEKLNRLELEEQLTRTRLEFLKSRLNPHFLFNTLNMVSSVMYEDPNAADKMLANLSAMLRTSLQSNGREIHSLKEELELLNLYIDIMKCRFNDKLDIKFTINENTLSAGVPLFLLQPIVENSIKYGMETLSVTKIEVSSLIQDNNLIIRVKDNGPGINEDYDIVMKKGIGISNTVERLEKYYPNNHKFDWENITGGLLMTISIPLRETANAG